MDLYFERVSNEENSKICQVYKIIKASGEHMAEEYGLLHWKIPYPMESIKNDCINKDVFLIKNDKLKEYVHTFQLEFLEKRGRDKGDGEIEANINKFATLPSFEGTGIGRKSMSYIENYCYQKDVTTISLDVYDQSKHAIDFYKNRGFHITSNKKTKYFIVYRMEKKIK